MHMAQHLCIFHSGLIWVLPEFDKHVVTVLIYCLLSLFVSKSQLFRKTFCCVHKKTENNVQLGRTK